MSCTHWSLSLTATILFVTFVSNFCSWHCHACNMKCIFEQIILVTRPQFDTSCVMQTFEWVFQTMQTIKNASKWSDKLPESYYYPWGLNRTYSAGDRFAGAEAVNNVGEGWTVLLQYALWLPMFFTAVTNGSMWNTVMGSHSTLPEKHHHFQNKWSPHGNDSVRCLLRPTSREDKS